MLDIGKFRARDCGGLSRRSFLRLGASLPAVLGAGAGTSWMEKSLLAQVPSAIAARAKSVLFVWLWGGPSQLDTFDPKPEAPAEYRGPFTPIETRTPGLLVTELLPQLAACSNLYTVIRSHVTSAPGHPDAGTVGLTGFAEVPQPVQPNFGSIVAKGRGQTGGLPPFISVGPGIPKDVVRIVEGYGGGRLGKTYDPFMVSCSADGKAEIPSLKLLEELSPQRLSDRQSLRNLFNHVERDLDAGRYQSWEQMYQRAYQLLTNEQARGAFDLSTESEQTRGRYGQTSFGQSCLLGRRLVEAGVPYVQVNWSEYVECLTPNCDFGWDTHIYNFELLQDRHGPIFDRAFSALLLDLDQRGLLDTTLVVAMGEFGRTPKLNNRAARDHWPQCYFSLWAGAGIIGGKIIGRSDPLTQNPVTEPITPLMVGTTIAELAGIGTQTRAEMGVLNNGSVIHELVD